MAAALRLDPVERDLLAKNLAYKAQGLMEEAAGQNVEGDVSKFLEAHAVIDEIAKAIRELIDKGETVRLHVCRCMPADLVDRLRANVGREATLLQRIEDEDPEVIGSGRAARIEKKETKKELTAVARECAVAERILEAMRLADPLEAGR